MTLSIMTPDEFTTKVAALPRGGSFVYFTGHLATERFDMTAISMLADIAYRYGDTEKKKRLGFLTQRRVGQSFDYIFTKAR